MRRSCAPGPIKALARSPRAPWKEAPTGFPKTWKTQQLKRDDVVRFRGAWGKGAMVFVECLGVLQEDTVEGPLWRKTLSRSLGSHDVAKLVGGMCHGNGFRQETIRPHAISCTKAG